MSGMARSTLRDEPRHASPMRLLVTGGTGVLGRALQPFAEAAGHELAMPGHEVHLATRIRSLEQISDPAGAAVFVQPTVTFVYPPDGHPQR